MAAHSSILAWKIPWIEEPGRLQSTGLQKSDTTERLHSLFIICWKYFRYNGFKKYTIKINFTFLMWLQECFKLYISHYFLLESTIV